MLLRTLTVGLVIVLSSITQAVNQRDQSNRGMVQLRGDTLVSAGSEFSVSIALADSLEEIGGFNLYIEFDFGAFVLDSAVLGDHLAGQWEYFTVRSGHDQEADSNSTTGFVRLIAIADSHNSPDVHPDPKSLRGPGEIARMHLYVGEHRSYLGTTQSLRFAWRKCSDNTFSDASGNKLLVANQVFDADDSLVTIHEYSGPQESCFKAGHNPPVRKLNFRNLSVRIR